MVSKLLLFGSRVAICRDFASSAGARLRNYVKNNLGGTSKTGRTRSFGIQTNIQKSFE